jgi:DNA-directed RNA polymerase subunit F
MQEILDEGIKILYAIIHDGEDAEAREDQKEAVEQIKRLAKSGNPDAVNALERLRRTPDMHPFLREILMA